MATEPLREHLEWHLRRLKGARAAAAEMSLRAQTDGLQWLSLTHFAVLALEATLAEEIAPDHKALDEVIGDLAALRAPVPTPAAPPSPPCAAPLTEPCARPRDLPPLAESWTSALASLQAMAFPWRPLARRPGATPPAPARDSNIRVP
jgi:hypothetical protein